MADSTVRAAFDEAGKAHKEGDFQKAEAIYTRLLNVGFNNANALYLLGDCLLYQGKHGLAHAVLKQAVAVAHDAPNTNELLSNAWIDIGACYRKEEYREDAFTAWEMARRYGDRADILNNLAGLFADGIEPEKALSYSDRGLALMKETEAGQLVEAQLRWGRALALLSLGRWSEAWPEHEWRKKLPSWHERNYGGAPEWDGRPDVALVVHGEQGIGDEIMFLSCLPDVLQRTRNVVVECEPRLIPLVRRSFGVLAYKDEQGVMASGFRPEAKVALSSLPLVVGRTDGEAWPAAPYLTADPAKVAAAKAWLSALGPAPHVGLAWVGGSRQTRISERSIDLKHLMGLPGTKVSVQYGPLGEKQASQNGLPHWAPFSGGDDMDAHAALIAALDVLVTVPQTDVHVAGALGTPCHVIVPEKAPSWRYARARMPWYSTVTLHRGVAALPQIAKVIGADNRQLQAA
jgi:hypothetical protein